MGAGYSLGAGPSASSAFGAGAAPAHYALRSAANGGTVSHETLPSRASLEIPRR